MTEKAESSNNKYGTGCSWRNPKLVEDEELQEVCEKMMAILCLDSRNTRDSHLSMIRASGKTFLPPPNVYSFYIQEASFQCRYRWNDY